MGSRTAREQITRTPAGRGARGEGSLKPRCGHRCNSICVWGVIAVIVGLVIMALGVWRPPSPVFSSQFAPLSTRGR